MDRWIDAPVAAGACLLALCSLVLVLRERAAALRARVAARVANRTKDALLSAARELISASRESPHEVVAVLDRAIRSCTAQVDAIAVFERRDDHLLCTYASGRRLEHFKERALALDGEAICARAARAGFRCIARSPQAMLHPSDRTSLAVPFMGPVSAFAVLGAGSRSELSPGAIELIVALAEQTTPAYLLALERDDDRRRAAIDGLTGLLTPRAFRKRIREEITYARSDSRARLALLFIDTDHFKDWNDTYGHASGDAVLRRLADMLRGYAPAARDLAARNGGDEFCLVFADIEKSEAIERARTLCAAIAAHDWDAERPQQVRRSVAITASIGVAAFPRDARSADDLLERADAAMYHSKHAGRNRVSYYDDGALVSTQGEVEVTDDRTRAR